MKSISIKNLGKRFRRSFRGDEGILYRLFSIFKTKEKFEVLRNISFDLDSGETVGVIGRNGSGKSTLLKTIAGIYLFDEGSMVINGSVDYLSGFGHGLQKRLTMRENIYLMGLLRGLCKERIEELFEEIVDFSGLRKFLDSKVYQLSTGMLNRLNFSIIIHCLINKNSEILLIDEAFSSGVDLKFKEKFVLKMEELIASGSSVVFVSHNLRLIDRYCKRVIWLEDGRVIMDGNSEEVIAKYKGSNNDGR
jgi:ABC-type polysaccharide/polyol phosphate transport system ATPase subunit